MNEIRYAVMKTCVRLPYGNRGKKWLAARGLSQLEEKVVMSCDTEPETLREYVSIEDARSYLHEHMREMRFIKASSLIAMVLLAETIFIEKRVYSANGSYTAEALSDVYCPIPRSFDRVNMVFLEQEEKDITDDDDDGRNDDFD